MADTVEVASAAGSRDPAVGLSAVRSLRTLVERLETLLDRYGTRAGDIAALIAKETDRPLKSQPDYSHQEIAYLATREKCVHLDDLILRRSMLAKLGRLTPVLIEEIGEVAGDVTRPIIGKQSRSLMDNCAIAA